MTATVQTNIEAADLAVRLTPNDPEAHYTRAIVLGNLERLSEASVELNHAISLRPHHYYEWLDLAVTMDRLGDQPAAVKAVGESIRLAPSFAQPRWQSGNLLFREGKYDEAFVQLRLGANSNTNLIPSLLVLGWVAADGDVRVAESLIQPRTPLMHLAFAKYLAEQGRGADAAQQAKAAGQPQDETERNLFYHTIEILINSKEFANAYLIWSIRHPSAGDMRMVTLLNGDFSEPIEKNDFGFGWQLAVVPNLTVNIDPNGPRSKGRSLQMRFSGDSDPSSDLIHQLILVEAKGRYTLTFLARTRDLVTGGPPIIAVLDASNPGRILSQTKPVSTGTTDWANYRSDFVCDAEVSAVIVVVRRIACPQAACPVFGDLWLGGFTLTKL